MNQRKVARVMLILYAGCLLLTGAQSDIHQRSSLTQLRRWLESNSDIESCGRIYCGKPPTRQSNSYDQYLRCVAVTCVLMTTPTSDNPFHSTTMPILPVISDPDIILCPQSSLYPGQVLKYCDSRTCWIHSRQDNDFSTNKESLDSTSPVDSPKKDDISGACIREKCEYGRRLSDCATAHSCCYHPVSHPARLGLLDDEEGSVDVSSELIGSALEEGVSGRLTRKRRVNDDVSQCIQSYCSGKVIFPQRLRCIVQNCHRSGAMM